MALAIYGVALVAFLGALAWTTPVSQAAVINYTPPPLVGPSYTFTNISESSGTEAVPLYGAPTLTPGGLDFNPATFVSSASGGAADITDGQLNFTIASNSPLISIDAINILEAGDFSLLGGGTSSTQALVGLILRATVTEINGLPVAPIVLSPVNASAGFNLAANLGITQPWALGAVLNINSLLSTGQRATRVDVAINNQLATLSESGTIAFIAKKEFLTNITTTAIPEPSLLGLASVGGLLLLRRRAKA